MLTRNRLWALGPPCLLLEHTYLYYTHTFFFFLVSMEYYTHTCTIHYTSYIKALIYILLLMKYNIMYSVFLTWKQSHYYDLSLSNLVSLGVTPLLSFSSSQQSPQPLTIEPLTSFSHCPWVLDLQHCH